ncbi:MAG: hypothetical protein ACLURP_08075 [Ruminococcus sp.]
MEKATQPHWFFPNMHSDISSGNFQSGIATPCKSLTFMSLVKLAPVFTTITQELPLGAF